MARSALRMTSKRTGSTSEARARVGAVGVVMARHGTASRRAADPHVTCRLAHSGRHLREHVALEPAWDRADPFAPAFEHETSRVRLAQRQVAPPPADQGPPVSPDAELLRKAGVRAAERHFAAPEQQIVPGRRPTYVRELDAHDERLRRERVTAHPAMDVPDQRPRIELARAQLARQPPLAP